MRAMVLLLLAACASSSRAVPDAPPTIAEPRVAPAALNPVGEYEFSTMTPEGTPINGTVTITGSPGAYTGSINAHAQGIFPIKSVVVDGQTLTIKAEHPQGPLDVRLTFVANDFTGSWQLGTDSGEMKGKRKP